jgi:hypothetical protein
MPAGLFYRDTVHARGGTAMEMRVFGRTGMQLSALGFGCGAVGGLMVRGDPVDQERTIARATAAGVNYFDTAVQYGNGESESARPGRQSGQSGITTAARCACASIRRGTRAGLSPAWQFGSRVETDLLFAARARGSGLHDLYDRYGDQGRAELLRRGVRSGRCNCGSFRSAGLRR